MNIKEIADILDVSEITIRRAFGKGAFNDWGIEGAESCKPEKANGAYNIEYYQLLKFIADNPKYEDAIPRVIEEMCKSFQIPISNNNETEIEQLQIQMIKKLISKAGDQLLESFNCFLETYDNNIFLPNTMRSLENRLDVAKQPSVTEIIKILRDVVVIKTHKEIEIGQVLTADQIETVFGRKPQQEGINFCKETKELFVITKLGNDNPNLLKAEYNDFWKHGKIYYEGKGQDEIQEFKGSNLHLYRKYQVFKGIIRCKENVPRYIHVFNRIKVYETEKFQYLGIFDVSDYFVDNHSIGRTRDTKIAILYEFTPIVDKVSTLIDDNYIFNV